MCLKVTAANQSANRSPLMVLNSQCASCVTSPALNTLEHHETLPLVAKRNQLFNKNHLFPYRNCPFAIIQALIKLNICNKSYYKLLREKDTNEVNNLSPTPMFPERKRKVWILDICTYKQLLILFLCWCSSTLAILIWESDWVKWDSPYQSQVFFSSKKSW